MATTYSDEEAVRRAQEFYDREIRATVEPGNEGKLLVINVETGEYVMDADDGTAWELAKSAHPDAELFALRVGFPTAYRLGSRSRRQRR